MWDYISPEFQSSYDDGYVVGVSIDNKYINDFTYCLKINPYYNNLNYERWHVWNTGFFDGMKKKLKGEQNNA